MKGLRSTLRRLLPAPIVKARDYCVNVYRTRQRYLQERRSASVAALAQMLIDPHTTIYCYPEAPYGGSVLFRLCALAGCAVTTDPRCPAAAAFHVEYATYSESHGGRGGQPLARKAVNGRCLDISKRTVGERFEQAFGYALEVDPLRYDGPLVEKSNRNGAHDGQVLQGPLRPEQVQENKVYQRAIDNSTRGGHVVDHRVPVFGRHIPFVYLKYRPREIRFTTKNVLVRMVETDEVFSSSDVENILAFCKGMGLDYGELDVLRDRDGRLFVVDANDTPFWPVGGLSERMLMVALVRLTDAFCAFVDDWPSHRQRAAAKGG